MENNFAQNLRYLRKERKLGQVELARSINASKGIISLWENGQREPTLSYLIALANFFGITLDELAC